MEKLQMRPTLVFVFLLVCNGFAQASCLDEANAVRDAMIKAGPYREIENSLLNGRILTRIIDVVPPDRVEKSTLYGSGKGSYEVVIGPTVWLKPSGEDWAKPKKNEENWSSSILNAQLAIRPMNPKVECNMDTETSSKKLKILSWQEPSVSDLQMKVKIWVDPNTLSVERLQKTFIDENGAVDHVAESLFISVPKLEVKPPIP
jgi:hypothetical protein